MVLRTLRKLADRQEERNLPFCYWAFPENYSHVAMRQVRRLDLMWQGADVQKYESLKDDARKAGMSLPDFVKDVLAKIIKQ